MNFYSKNFWTILFIWIVASMLFLILAEAEGYYLTPEQITLWKKLCALIAFTILGSGLLAKNKVKQSAKN